jgi:hypothetical protein
LFNNVNVADCGVFTSCYLKPVGCTGTYAGKAKVTPVTFGLEVTQNTDAGYTELLCIVCQNLAGSKAQHDNWKIH